MRQTNLVYGGSIGHRGCWLTPEMGSDQFRQVPKRSVRMATATIRISDAEQQGPLLIKRLVGVKKRSAWVVDIGRFRGHTVQFDDGQIFPGLKCSDIGITHVESAEV